MDVIDVFKDAISGYTAIETTKAANQPPQWYQWGQQGYGGMPGAFQPAMGGVSPMVLLIGAGVLAFVLLRD